MTKFFNRLVLAGAIFLMTVSLVACGGGGGGGGGTTGLRIGLTDAPGDYQNVFITIKEIQVNKATEGEAGEDAGWLTVLTPGETYDLTTLRNGTITNLGLTDLEAGRYNQLRLILEEEKPESHPYANYLIREGDEANPIELNVPSGFRTGIKIVQGFDIVAGGVTDLVLDFDANKSVVQAGKSGQWQLKPTIKILETINNSVSGTVDAGEENWLEGVSVTAQKYDGAADLKDQVAVAGSSASDILGDYFMYLPPDSYNIVAAEAGYLPYCQEVDAATEFGPHPGIDFTLTEAAIGSATGNVTGLEVGATATLSFRQTVGCENGGADVQIEILSVNIAADGSYDMPLSAGDYQLVASAENETTQEFSITVAGGAPTPQDISFE